jgi:hypothetical protein
VLLVSLVEAAGQLAYSAMAVLVAPVAPVWLDRPAERAALVVLRACLATAAEVASAVPGGPADPQVGPGNGGSDGVVWRGWGCGWGRWYRGGC